MFVTALQKTEEVCLIVELSITDDSYSTAQLNMFYAICRNCCFVECVVGTYFSGIFSTMIDPCKSKTSCDSKNVCRLNKRMDWGRVYELMVQESNVK